MSPNLLQYLHLYQYFQYKVKIYPKSVFDGKDIMVGMIMSGGLIELIILEGCLMVIILLSGCLIVAIKFLGK